MHNSRSVFWTLVLSATLSACGGGGGGSGAYDPLNPPAAVSLAGASSHYGIGASGDGGDSSGDSGVSGGAGDGAPRKRSVLTMIDALGNQVSGETDDNGLFLLKYNSAVFRAPFVLRSVDAGGNVLTSVLENAPTPGTVALANINPLTDKITSDSLQAAIAGTDKVFDGRHIDPSKLQQAKADLLNSIKLALQATGFSDVSRFDPIRSLYAQDGTGVDAITESLGHSRDAVNGRTQLTVKLQSLQNSAAGQVLPNLVTANTPLPTSSLSLASSAALTFSKLRAWTASLNRCLALAPTARNAVTECSNAGVGHLLSGSYLHEGRLASDDLPVATGTSLRNPVVLFTGKYPGSAASYDDAARVEFTVLNPPSANGDPAFETRKVLVFKRDDTLTQAVAGNWILNGDQNQYGCTASTLYQRYTELNPATNANTPGQLPSRLQVGLALDCNPAGIQYVVVTGPGIPPAGITLAPSSSSASMAITSKTGAPYVSVPTTNVGNVFVLSAIGLDGQPLYGSFWNGSAITNASALLSDFSPFGAYARYTFEVHLSGVSSPVYEYAYNLAPIVAPAQALLFPVNDLTPSLPLVTPDPNGLPASTLTVAWAINLNAAPVMGAQVVGGTGFSSPDVVGSTNVLAAYTSGARPTSQIVQATSGQFPALQPITIGLNRRVLIQADQARGHIQNILEWVN